MGVGDRCGRRTSFPTYLHLITMNLSISTVIWAAMAGALTAAPQNPQAPDMLDQQVQPEFRKDQIPFGAYDVAAGHVVADGARHRVDFRTSGVSLTVPAATAGAEQPRLDLTYLGSTRGFANRPATTDVDPVRSAEFIRYLRGNVVETYEATATGFEQTFHLSQQPQGHGDLVVAMAVSGNVTAEPMAASHAAIEFEHGNARPIRYSEAYAYDRAGLRVDVMTRYDGAGRLELIVPDKFLTEATYPIVIDPSVGPVFNPGGATWNDVNPDVAFDPNNETYLVVWQRVFTTSSIAIRGQLYDKNGGAITGYFAIESGLCREPAVAYFEQPGATGFMVVWAQTNMIRGRMFNSATAAPIGTSFNVTGNLAGNEDRRPTIAGPGSITVAWDRKLSGQAEPTEIGMRSLSIPVAGQPMNITGTVDFIVESVSGGGIVRDVRLAQSDVRRTIGGADWFQNRLVWQRWYTSPAPGDWDCRTASVRTNVNNNGIFYEQNATNLSGAASIGPSELRPCIAARASVHGNPTDLQYCVAWEDEGDVHAQMYDGNGPQGSMIVIQDTPEFEGIPSVAAGFCEFTVSYGETVAPAEFSFNIYAARVLLDGTVAIDDREVDVPNGPFQNHIRSASRPIQDSPTESNTTLITWYGATGPTGGVNDVRARFFEPVEPNTTFFGSACPGPAGELPQIGSQDGPAIPGNPDFKVTVTNSPPLTLAAVVISGNFTTTPIPGAPGCSLYAGLPLITALPTVVNGVGNGSVNVPIPCSIPSGAGLAFQWAIYTPGHNAFGWIVSNDMDIFWSHF